MTELIKITEHNGKSAVSARELSSLGYKLNPFASLHSLNKPVFNKNGEMVDLMIHPDNLDASIIAEQENRENKRLTKNLCTYLILDKGSGLYKIGKAQNVQIRLKSIKGMCPTAELIASCKADFEKELHDHFEIKKETGEWFHLSQKDVIWIKNKFNKKKYE